MSDYDLMLSRAIAALSQSTPEARQELYERARSAQRNQLRKLQPPMAATEIEMEERALNEAIARVDAKIKKTSRDIAINASALFRKELFAAKREAWLGSVQVVQPLPIRVVATVSAALIFACLIYMIFGTYTRRVHATGILAPDKGLIIVSSPAAGIVGSTAASEGQKVKKGQLLYVVDLDATTSSGPTQQHVIAALKEQKQIIEKQKEFRRSMAGVEKQALAARLQNLMQQHAHVKSQIDTQRDAISLLKAKTDQLQGAVSRGLVRDSDFQSQNYLRMQAVAQQAQYEQLALQLEDQLSETGASLALFDNKLDRDINEMDRSILQLDQLVTENEAKRSVEVQAPEDGTLTGLRAHAGQRVGAGAALVTLLPSEGKLKPNLFVDSSAIGFIERSEPVFLRYAPFPFQRFGLYHGQVAEVTRAPIANFGATSAQTGAAQPRDAEDGALYRVVVELGQQFVLAYGERQPLEAGMRVDADIALEKRSLYRWLLDPVSQLRSSINIVTGSELK
jgi:membrane fusion protein